MATDLQIQSFNAALFSEYLDGRDDLEKYYSACRIYDNMIPLPYGPAERRPGTYFVGEVKDNSKKARLMPFQFSTLQAYQIEYGDEYCRFYKDRGQIKYTDISFGANPSGDFPVGVTMTGATSGATAIVVAKVSTQVYTIKFEQGTWTDGEIINCGGENVDCAANYPTTEASSTAVEITTNYLEADLPGLQRVQSADVLYNTHSTHPPTKIKRFSHDYWDAEVIIFDWPPFLSENLTGITITPAIGTESLGSVSGDCISQWKMNDDAASTVVVDAKAANNGTAQQNTEDLTVAGKINTALSFNGTTDRINLLADGSGLSLTTAATFAFWVKLNVQGNDRLFGYTSTWAQNGQWIFFTTPTTLYFACRNGGVVSYSTKNIDLTKTWHFIIGVWSGGAATLYVDGVAQTAGSVVNGNLNNSELIRLGTAAAADNLDGQVDNTMIFNKALSQSEIDELHAVNLTASSSIFTSDHIGSYWLIKHPRTADDSYEPNKVGSTEADGFLNAAGEVTATLKDVKGPWRFRTAGTWTGEIVVERSYDEGSTWHTLETVTSEGDQNFNIAGNEEIGDAWLRARAVDPPGTLAWANEAIPTLTVERYYHYGIIRITEFNSSTSVEGTSVRTVGLSDATKLWSEGAWSDERGYPVTSDFFEGRQYFAGSTSRPLDIWGSKVHDYENMRIGTLDDDPVKFTVDSGMQNQIRWLVGQDVLLIGTSGAEWKLGSSDPADAITPTNPIRPKKQTTYGSKAIQAILLANAILFVDTKGRKVRGAQFIFEKGEAGGYDAPDYTMFAEHITESGVVEMAYQQNPYPILWCVLADGTLIGMVFEPGQKVWGWFPCVIDGLVESVSVNFGVTEDEVWIIVKRTINGETKRYIEYFMPRDWGSDQADCFFVDSGLTFNGGDAVDISDITKADPAVVTVSTWPTDGDGNNIADGDQVKIKAVVGMTQVNNKVFTVASADVSGKTFELRDKLDSVDISTLGSGFTTYVSGGTVEKVDNVFSGLGHLEGKTVSVLGDGSVHADVVVNSGIATLTDYYNKCHIGLPFISKLQPMKLAVPGAGIRGKKKRIPRIIFSFYKTLGAKFGTTVGIDNIPFRKMSDPTGAPPPLFTGEKEQTFPGGYELNGDIYVEQTQPLPMTVRSITPRLKLYDG